MAGPRKESEQRVASVRRSLWLIPAVVLCGAGLGGIAGCGPSGPERVAAKGTVKFDGQPLSQAIIQFIPLDTAGGRKTGSEIVEGVFDISEEDGICVGRNRVEISTYVAPEFGPRGDVRGTMREQPKPRLIPDRYNLNSTLTVEVLAGRENTFRFELTSSGPTRTNSFSP